MTESEVFVTYGNPPVAEVVCGVTFSPPEGITLGHLGGFWQALRDFPTCNEAEPLVARDGEPEDYLEPRLQFISANGSEVVQVQKDRFLCNWRRRPSGEYPRYSQVSTTFWKHFDLFQQFLTEKQLPRAQPHGYELRYINHIRIGEGWESISKLGNLLTDGAWNGTAHSFLPAPVVVERRLAFALPENAGLLRCRTHTATFASNQQQVVVLDLWASGYSLDARGWFSLAHEWIVRGFGDLTQDAVQREVWGRE